jgi:hypothetical protein
MTGYTVHTGSTVKFSSSWDRIFSGAEKRPKSAATPNVSGQSPVKKTPRKATKNAATEPTVPALKKATVKKSVAKGAKKRG